MTNSPSLALLFEYEQKLEPIASKISVMCILLKKDVDDYTVSFGLQFNDDNAYNTLKEIVDDTDISESKAELFLSSQLASVQNEYQALALYRTLKRLRDQWLRYIERFRKVIVISQSVKYELEAIVNSKRKFGLFNYPRALEGLDYILSFASKFLGVFCVIETYYKLLASQVVDPDDAGHQPDSPKGGAGNGTGDTTLTDDYWSKTKNVFNPPMSLNQAKTWFMQLAKNYSSNSNPFLTEKQVEQFIIRAFVGDESVDKLTINHVEGERRSITKLFYLFFQRCITDYAIEPKKQCKEKYVRLLTDNFTNFNYDTVFSSFNNSKTSAKRWDTTVL